MPRPYDASTRATVADYSDASVRLAWIDEAATQIEQSLRAGRHPAAPDGAAQLLRFSRREPV